MRTIIEGAGIAGWPRYAAITVWRMIRTASALNLTVAAPAPP